MRRSRYPDTPTDAIFYDLAMECGGYFCHDGTLAFKRYLMRSDCLRCDARRHVVERISDALSAFLDVLQ